MQQIPINRRLPVKGPPNMFGRERTLKKKEKENEKDQFKIS